MEEIFKIKGMLYTALAEIEALEKKLKANDTTPVVIKSPVKPTDEKPSFEQTKVDWKKLLGQAGREMEQCRTQNELREVFSRYNDRLKTSTKYSSLAKSNWERCSR